MMLLLRSMAQEAAWTAVMTALAQARAEATDTDSVLPLIMATREQVIDILTLLQPFEEALQVENSNTLKSSELCNTVYHMLTFFFCSDIGPSRKWCDSLLDNTLPYWP